MRARAATVAFDACCAAGAVLGLLSGLHRHTASVRCADLRGCSAHALFPGIAQVLVPTGAGVLTGAAIGAALALLIRRGRQPEAADR